MRWPTSSSSGHAVDANVYLEAGVDNYMSKPLLAQTLSKLAKP